MQLLLFFPSFSSSLIEEYNAAAGAGWKYNGHLGTPFIDPCLFGWLLFFFQPGSLLEAILAAMQPALDRFETSYIQETDS